MQQQQLLSLLGLGSPSAGVCTVYGLGGSRASRSERTMEGQATACCGCLLSSPFPVYRCHPGFSISALDTVRYGQVERTLIVGDEVLLTNKNGHLHRTGFSNFSGVGHLSSDALSWHERGESLKEPVTGQGKVLRRCSHPAFLPPDITLPHLLWDPHSVAVVPKVLMVPNQSPQLSQGITVRELWGAGSQLGMCHL